MEDKSESQKLEIVKAQQMIQEAQSKGVKV